MRSLTEHSLTIDLHLMMRRGWLKDEHRGRFRMRLSSGEFMRVFYDLRDPHDAWIELNYRQFLRADVQPEVAQYIPLTFTEPHYGGRRWWMVYGGERVAKLYLPPGGSNFGSRKAWGLVHSSQRADARERAFGRLHRLQRKLECEERWGVEPSRPTGMWRSKFNRLFAQYREAEDLCLVLTEEMLSEMRSYLA